MRPAEEILTSPRLQIIGEGGQDDRGRVTHTHYVMRGEPF